ncbi:TIGR03016 family PEP-CTERM system-associated outer membrane protein [Mitsuaria sp. GD03876]|uniref:TIGR03016 family PEP-CTERM system-associated outer membrane protein n=1 Tax=Mitsuaria sp. GD03876 TaxID=2975399 RepID=UPI00244815AB|nr:TIGR03016 family PEP-CTERM system-associated outer membrane protein [Mitsuaria sp. GD03876]MDH0868386.1 TIGR03016 family PEP-CTERM system-associated outer membrane protein [Mitsuaria sp. GD03876]
MTRPPVHRRRPLSLACAAALATLAVLAHAPARGQDSGGDSGSRKGWTIEPKISVTETWTDNLQLAPDGFRDKAIITAVSPGISISSNSGAVRGNFDYTLDGLVYTKSERSARVQNQLNTRILAELVPQALFVDVRGNVSQQSISAFGQQSTNNQLDSPNRTEVRSLQVSPYWRGILAGLATFELRATGLIRSSSDGGGGAGSSASGDSKQGTLSLGLSGPQGRVFNWGLNASTQRIHFDQTGVDNRTSSLLGSLYWIPDVDWTLGVNAGRERSDYFGSETSTIYGVTARWTPTPRTRIDGEWQHHSYGNSHNLALEHRMQQIALRVSSSQSVQTNDAPTGQATNYQLLDLQFQGIQPDPVKRDALVRAVLAAMGLNGDALTGNGFISNTAMLQRRTELSIGYTGPRLVATLGANDSLSRRLGVSPTGSGDLALTNRLRQRGASVSLGYRFTPLTTGSLSVTRQHTAGDDVGSTDMTSLLASVAMRVGPRADASFGLRHTKFDDNAFGNSGYRENAVYASLSQRF